MQRKSFKVMSLAFLIITSCNSETAHKQKDIPKPGALIASAEMQVNDDTLNKSMFTIKVVADSDVQKGVYDVTVTYGANTAEGKFTMPKGGEQLAPLIRKSTAPYTYIIGFQMEGDTTFYDYFEVSSSRTNTKMQYTKAYSF
jgi:hypothetical protein